MSNLKIIQTFSDDHIECVTFTYNDVMYDLMWCGGEFVGRLTMIADEEITFEKGLKKYPQFVSALTTGDLTLVDDDDEEQTSYQTDAGLLNMFKKKA